LSRLAIVILIYHCHKAIGLITYCELVSLDLLQLRHEDSSGTQRNGNVSVGSLDTPTEQKQSRRDCGH
jgi:hypothetical protein